MAESGLSLLWFVVIMQCLIGSSWAGKFSKDQCAGKEDRKDCFKRCKKVDCEPPYAKCFNGLCKRPVGQPESEFISNCENEDNGTPCMASDCSGKNGKKHPKCFPPYAICVDGVCVPGCVKCGIPTVPTQNPSSLAPTTTDGSTSITNDGSTDTSSDGSSPPTDGSTDTITDGSTVTDESITTEQTTEEGSTIA